MKGITLTIAQVGVNVASMQYGFKGHHELDISLVPALAQAFIKKPMDSSIQTIKYGINLLKKKFAPKPIPQILSREDFRRQYQNQRTREHQRPLVTR